MLENDLYARDERAIASLQKLRFFPLALTGGEGVHVIAEDGRRLLDFSAAWGAASLGYGHPALIEAVTRAVRNPAGASILSATSEDAVALAEDILATLPEFVDSRVWFGHSGSDACETACRAVVAATGRKRIVAFTGAYHGGSAGSMAISGHGAQSHAARAEGLLLIPYPNDDPSGTDVLELLEKHFGTDCPPHEVAALFLEPIQSDGGLIVPPSGFFKSLTDLCRSHGILVVCDEVKVGLGRSGLLHCFRHEGFVPDLLCLGKGLGGGLPLSALVGPATILNRSTAFAMQTLHGNPISAAAGRAVLATIGSQDLAGNAKRAGTYLLNQLQALKSHHHMIADVRGRGLVFGVEVASKTQAAQAVTRAFELGLVLYYVGQHSNVLEMTPPLVLTNAHVDEAVAILDQTLKDVAAGRAAPAPRFQGW